jgi:hypothetical protein
MGSNSQGISDPVSWELVSGPTVVGGIATLVIRYIGEPIVTYATQQPTVWVETSSQLTGSTVNSSVVAIHEDGSTSSDVSSATTNPGLLLVLPVHAGNLVGDWTYTPEP